MSLSFSLALSISSVFLNATSPNIIAPSSFRFRFFNSLVINSTFSLSVKYGILMSKRLTKIYDLIYPFTYPYLNYIIYGMSNIFSPIKICIDYFFKTFLITFESNLKRWIREADYG